MILVFIILYGKVEKGPIFMFLTMALNCFYCLIFYEYLYKLLYEFYLSKFLYGYTFYIIKIQLDAVSRTQQGWQREPSVKTPRSPHSGGITYWVAELNAALSLNTRDPTRGDEVLT